MNNKALPVLHAIVLIFVSTAFSSVAPAAEPPKSENQQFAELKAQLAQQQQQIEELRKVLAEQKKMLEGALKVADTGSTQSSPAPIDRTKPVDVGQVASTSPIIPAGVALKPSAIPPVMPVVATAAQTPPPPPPAPLQIHIGEATITPVGFMDLTNTFRSTNAGTSLQTNFGSIPYNNTIPGRLTEDKLSVANSRIGFRVDAKVGGTNILGYYEGDFVGGVGNGANNTQVSSNSLLYRIRLYWVDARRGQFEFLGGQSWSMLTPNRKQISALPADLFYSQVVDVNYMNGLTWGRIPGFRMLYHFADDKVTAGISFENAAQYFGGSGGGGTPTLPAALSSSTVDLRNNELDANVANGVAIANVHPDIIGKLAFDPSSHVHFEVAGVERTFKLFNPITQKYFTTAGGGGSVNGNFEVVKGFRLITNNYWSDGGGRYLFGVAPDLIVRADGSPSLIHSGSTLDGFEATLKNTLIYGYYGGIYIGRNVALDTNGSLIGYGYRGSANSHNRTTQEGSVGLTQTFWRNPQYGALQLMFQYAYLFRNPWFVAPGAPKNTHENAVWFNLRYTLPGGAPAIKY